MKKGLLINKETENAEVMIFKRPHTQSIVVGFVPNKTECTVLEGPMSTKDHYPGIRLYKVRTAEHEGYVNVKHVKVRK